MARTSSIYTVTGVKVVVYRSEPPSALITANGETATLGWGNLHLSPRVYVKPPSDGIWDFDFVGDPPHGHAAQVVDRVETSVVWEYPEGAVGVRVHAAVGPPIVRMFKDAQSERDPSMRIAGGEKPAPWGFGGDKPFPWAALPSVVKLDGTLRAVAAIGGETTGTTISTTVEIDLSRVPHKALDGKSARVLGWFEVRHYVERGPVLTFVASIAELDEAPPKR